MSRSEAHRSITPRKPKAWSIARSLHDLKAFALPLPVETSNTESPTPMHIYFLPPTCLGKPSRDGYSHHMKRCCCFVAVF